MSLKILAIAFAVLLLLGTVAFLTYELSSRVSLDGNASPTIKQAEEKTPSLAVEF